MKHANKVKRDFRYRSAKETSAPGYLQRRFQEVRASQAEKARALAEQQAAIEKEAEEKVKWIAGNRT